MHNNQILITLDYIQLKMRSTSWGCTCHWIWCILLHLGLYFCHMLALYIQPLFCHSWDLCYSGSNVFSPFGSFLQTPHNTLFPFYMIPTYKCSMCFCGWLVVLSKDSSIIVWQCFVLSLERVLMITPLENCHNSRVLTFYNSKSSEFPNMSIYYLLPPLGGTKQSYCISVEREAGSMEKESGKQELTSKFQK
jgi:hypothetical protein